MGAAQLIMTLDPLIAVVGTPGTFGIYAARIETTAGRLRPTEFLA